MQVVVFFFSFPKYGSVFRNAKSYYNLFVVLILGITYTISRVPPQQLTWVPLAVMTSLSLAAFHTLACRYNRDKHLQHNPHICGAKGEPLLPTSVGSSRLFSTAHAQHCAGGEPLFSFSFAHSEILYGPKPYVISSTNLFIMQTYNIHKCVESTTKKC